MTELRDYVHETQTTLQALARQAGVSAAQLSRVASGKSAPSPRLARRLETVTAGRVNAGRLLGLHANPSTPVDAPADSRGGSLAAAIAGAQKAFADRRDPERHSSDQLRSERNWEFHKEEMEIAEMKLDVHRP